MIFARGKNSGAGIQRLVDRLFYTPIGAMVVSGLFGMALALMFQRVCKGGNCIRVQAPPMNEVRNYVYQMGEDECYVYKPRVVKCA